MTVKERTVVCAGVGAMSAGKREARGGVMEGIREGVFVLCMMSARRCVNNNKNNN